MNSAAWKAGGVSHSDRPSAPTLPDLLGRVARDVLGQLSELREGQERARLERFFGEPTSPLMSLYGEVRLVRFEAGRRIHLVDSAMIPAGANELVILASCGRNRLESQATVVDDAGAEICEQCTRALA
ncbi:hypothetical protein JCM18899A_19110 [Nocardioides sp. AN3]